MSKSSLSLFGMANSSQGDGDRVGPILSESPILSQSSAPCPQPAVMGAGLLLVLLLLRSDLLCFAILSSDDPGWWASPPVEETTQRP